MMSDDDQHQAHEILDSVISNDEIQEFIAQCLQSPGVNTALYSIFASHDYHKGLLLERHEYGDQARVESWHRSLLTAFAVGVTISRSFTKLENSLWDEGE
jgi:hypothetical protein